MPFSLALFLEIEAVPIYHYSCLVFHVVGKQAKGSRRSIIGYKKNRTGVSENVNSLDIIKFGYRDIFRYQVFPIIEDLQSVHTYV